LQCSADNGRMLTYGIKEYQWDPYIRNVFQLLIPGNGWAQFSELTIPMWDNDDVPADAPIAEVPTQILLSTIFEPKITLFSVFLALPSADKGSIADWPTTILRAETI